MNETGISLGCSMIAQRMANAFDGLVENLSSLGGISTDAARVVAKSYIRNRYVKLDAVGGTYNAKHGAFFDRDVIERAAKGSLS